jgi:hypothetical protein
MTFTATEATNERGQPMTQTNDKPRGRIKDPSRMESEVPPRTPDEAEDEYLRRAIEAGLDAVQLRLGVPADWDDA